MFRRDCLVLSSVVVSVALAGCSSSSDDDPETVVRAYVDALDEADFDEMQALTHEATNPPVTEDELEQLEDLEYSVSGVDVGDETDDEVIAETELSMSGRLLGQERNEVETGEITLRRENGDWRVYDFDGYSSTLPRRS